MDAKVQLGQYLGTVRRRSAYPGVRGLVEFVAVTAIVIGAICAVWGLVLISDSEPSGMSLLIFGLAEIGSAVMLRAFALVLFDMADLLCVIAQARIGLPAALGSASPTAPRTTTVEAAIEVEGIGPEEAARMAQEMFDEARRLLKAGKKQAARELLEVIARDHPDTTAGRRAAHALAGH